MSNDRLAMRLPIGFIDRIDRNIEGWVLTPRPSRVTCQIEGWTAHALPGLYRQDVAEAGYRDGYVGFSIPIPEAFFDGRLHSVTIDLPAFPSFVFPGFPRDVLLGIPKICIAGVNTDLSSDYSAFWKRHLLYDFDAVIDNTECHRLETQVKLIDQHPKGVILGAWSASDLVAFCLLEPDSEEANTAILRVVVLAPYRRLGIGGRLIEAAIEHGKAIGLQRIVLSVDQRNEVAQRLYRRYGFLLDCPDPESYKKCQLHVIGMLRHL